MYASQKLTAAAIKELATLAPEVAAKVKDLQTAHRTRKVSFTTRPAGFQYILGEGERMTFFAPNGKSCPPTWSARPRWDAANTGINYAVNKPTPPLPEGTWIVSRRTVPGQVVYLTSTTWARLPSPTKCTATTRSLESASSDLFLSTRFMRHRMRTTLVFAAHVQQLVNGPHQRIQPVG